VADYDAERHVNFPVPRRHLNTPGEDFPSYDAGDTVLQSAGCHADNTISFRRGHPGNCCYYFIRKNDATFFSLDLRPHAGTPLALKFNQSSCAAWRESHSYVTIAYSLP